MAVLTQGPMSSGGTSRAKVWRVLYYVAHSGPQAPAHFEVVIVTAPNDWGSATKKMATALLAKYLRQIAQSDPSAVVIHDSYTANGLYHAAASIRSQGTTGWAEVIANGRHVYRLVFTFPTSASSEQANELAHLEGTVTGTFKAN